jgi:hypothetical protein
LSTEKRPNWFVTTIRNTVVSQVFQLLFVAAGGAGAVTGILGYLQGWPLAQIFTYSMVSAAAGAALVGYARRAIIDAGLRNKFYIEDLQVVEELGANGEIVGYLPWMLVHNLSDVPIHYNVEDLNGQLNRLALLEISKYPSMCTGLVQAKQTGWHALGIVNMPIPDGNRIGGRVRLRIAFGKNTSYIYNYAAAFELHLILDEEGAVQLTRAFRR